MNTNDESIKFIRQKFEQYDNRFKANEQLMGSIMLSLLSLNEMIGDLVDDEKKEEAIKKAASQLGKFKAVMESKNVDSERMFDQWKLEHPL